ncbi:hypothetical protein SRHO_G00104990 [Serrasalmus rhombeus]
MYKSGFGGCQETVKVARLGGDDDDDEDDDDRTGWHGGVVGSAVASQRGGPGFDSLAGRGVTSRPINGAFYLDQWFSAAFLNLISPVTKGPLFFGKNRINTHSRAQRVNRYRPPNFMWPSDQLKNSVESFMEWVSMAEQLHPSLTSPSAMQSMECSGVKRRHWTLEQWRRVLWSDQSRFSVWKSDGRVWFLERSQLRWFGHLVRMPPGRLSREVLQASPPGRRPRGRPRTCWRDYIAQLAWERLGIPPGSYLLTLTMEPNSPKKIQFAVPLFQSHLDPQAAEHVSKERQIHKSVCDFGGRLLSLMRLMHAGGPSETELSSVQISAKSVLRLVRVAVVIGLRSS